VLKKPLILTVLALVVLCALPGAATSNGSPLVNRRLEALAGQYFATAITYAEDVSAANPADTNATNAALFARYAQYYANYSAATGDRNAALAAYTYGYYAAIYAANSFNATGDMDAFTSFQFAWYGSYFALTGAGRR